MHSFLVLFCSYGENILMCLMFHGCKKKPARGSRPGCESVYFCSTIIYSETSINVVQCMQWSSRLCIGDQSI